MLGFGKKEIKKKIKKIGHTLCLKSTSLSAKFIKYNILLEIMLPCMIYILIVLVIIDKGMKT